MQDRPYQLTFPVAHVLGGAELKVKQYNGYIVSYKPFDYGTSPITNDGGGNSQTLKLTDSSNFRKINLVFLLIKLSNFSSECNEYLEISAGKSNNKFCGNSSHDPTVIFDFTPVQQIIINFNFVTSSSEHINSDFGFLIHYEAAACDIVKNGTVITYSCDDKTYRLFGGENATCMVNGNWSTSKPTCRLIGQSPGPEPASGKGPLVVPSLMTSSKSAISQGLATSTPQSGKISDTETSLPMYIGIAVGALAVAVAAVAVILCLYRRRRNRLKKNSIPLNDIDPGAQSTFLGDPDHERGTRDAGGYAGDGDDSGIALYSQVGEPTPAHTSDTNTNTSTTSPYLLAGELEEEEYGNNQTIQRAEQEKNMTDIYSPVMAATKTKKPGTDAVDMVDSEIYG